jgi:hypothetical protein
MEAAEKASCMGLASKKNILNIFGLESRVINKKN